MRSSDSGKKQNFFWRHFNGIAMAAIVLIPTIYTTLFLGSMWGSVRQRGPAAGGSRQQRQIGRL